MEAIRSYFGGGSSAQTPSTFTTEEAAVYERIQQLVSDFGTAESKLTSLLKSVKKGDKADETTSTSVKEELDTLDQKMKSANVDLKEKIASLTAAMGGAGTFPEKCSQALRSVVMKINTIFTALSESVDGKIIDPIEESLAKEFQEIYDAVLLRKEPERFSEVTEKEA